MEYKQYLQKNNTKEIGEILVQNIFHNYEYDRYVLILELISGDIENKGYIVVKEFNRNIELYDIELLNIKSKNKIFSLEILISELNDDLIKHLYRSKFKVRINKFD